MSQDDSKGGKMLHCFEHGPDCSVCLLPLDHPGEHQFTPGRDVSIEFIGDRMEIVRLPDLIRPFSGDDLP